jgi:hypothetical protein
MSQTLPQAAHERHERLMQHVDRIPVVADALLGPRTGDALAGLADLRLFLSGTLLPHVEAAERTLYPELERMFQNRHSMAPMRREHEDLRAMIAQLEAQVAEVGDSQVTVGRALALRRVMFRMYAMLKVHLAEEEAYMRLMDRSLTTDVADLLAAALEHPVGAG